MGATNAKGGSVSLVATMLDRRKRSRSSAPFDAFISGPRVLGLDIFENVGWRVWKRRWKQVGAGGGQQKQKAFHNLCVLRRNQDRRSTPSR